MKFFPRLILITALVFSQIPAANATQYLTGGIGRFDFTGTHTDSMDFAAEWRGNPFLYGFLPVIGAEVNTDSGMYGFVGINYDWEFNPNWYLTPSVAIGGWRRGDSTDLGGALEFREGLELDYKFPEGYRAGARFTHISNTGIYAQNPGEESLMATFSIPLTGEPHQQYQQ